MQPTKKSTSEPTDDAYPTVGELLSFTPTDGSRTRIVEVFKDHGAARIYTIRGTEEIPVLVAIDEHGVFYTLKEQG